MMKSTKEDEFVSVRAFRLYSGSFNHLINSPNIDTEEATPDPDPPISII